MWPKGNHYYWRTEYVAGLSDGVPSGNQPRRTAPHRLIGQPMFSQTIVDNLSIVSMPYCSVGLPVLRTAIR